MTTLHTEDSICIPSVKLLGDFWGLLIIDALTDGELHYSEIQRKIKGVNTVTLTSRLRKLEQGRLIIRTENSRADVVYKLTELGTYALPILDAVNEFSVAARRLSGDSQ